jgi:hypothetical protein
VSEALAPPFLVAALILCVAGGLKLRSPRQAVGALRTLGLPDRVGLVRVLACGEIALGVACLVHPTRATAGVLTGAYATFAGVAALLARRRVGCGCFGEDETTPVSGAHALLNGLVAVVAAAAAVSSPRGAAWLASRPAPTAAVLAVGTVGAAYAFVLLYTDVPRAWSAWSAE